MLYFARKICKNKTLILIIAILLLIPSFLGMKATRVNYDILVYLPENIETMQGQNILQNNFNMGSYSIVLLDNMKTKDIKKLEEKFRNTDNVEKVVGVSDILGTNIPVEMIPDDIKDKVYKDGTTALLVTFKEGISSDKTLETIET